MKNKSNVLIFSLTTCEELTNRVCKELGIEKSPSTCRIFADGEVFARPDVYVKGKDCVVIHSTCHPVNDTLMQLLVFIDALKRGGAKSICTIVPYFGYSRQDRIVNPGDPISVRLVTKCLEGSGCDHVVSVDYHDDDMASFFPGIKTTQLYSSPIFASYYRKRLEQLNISLNDVVVVFPDKGGLKRAKPLNKELGNLPVASLNKHRPEPNKAVIVGVEGVPVQNKYCLIFDDIIDTGGTLIAAIDELRKNKAKGILICGCHGVFSNHALDKLHQCDLVDVAVSDSIPQDDKSLSVVSLSPVIAKFIDENY